MSNQLNFPSSLPLLDLPFALKRTLTAFMRFVPNEAFAIVAVREAFYRMRAMFPGTAIHVVRHACVQNTIWFVGNYINGEHCMPIICGLRF